MLIRFLFSGLWVALGSTVSAQSKYTAEQALHSTDMQLIANFVKYNPDHSATPELKKKLVLLLNGDRDFSSAARSVATSTGIAVPAGAGTAAAIRGNTAKTVKMLNHLFSNDASKTEAYILVRNNSKCRLTVKIAGRDFYTLTVPAAGEDAVLVKKGAYTLGTSVCDVAYSSVKNVQGDMVVTYTSGK